LSKKMIRRFVNLVLEDNSRGRYSLHRLDVAKYLFYPSTAQAEAANAKKTRNEGGGGGSDKPKATNPPRIKRMWRLPEPSMSFSLFPPADDGVRKPDTWQFSSLMNNTFILLSPGRSEGRILHATQGGRTVVYDADAHAVIATTPSFPDPMERFPIAFSVPGAGGYMEEKESLYVMRSTISIISIELHAPTSEKESLYVMRSTISIISIELHAPTSSTQKLKLIGKGGQFTYTPTLPLTCRLPKAAYVEYWSGL
jgi:hypothetical protein